MQKKKILVPISFDRESEMALDFALMYSQNSNAEIYLFHVTQTKGSDYRELDRLNEETMARMKETFLKAIQRAQEHGIKHLVDNVHRRVAHGKPWDEILRMAGGISADLVIMGSPESRSFIKMLGKMPCSTVLVREKDVDFVME